METQDLPRKRNKRSARLFSALFVAAYIVSSTGYKHRRLAAGSVQLYTTWSDYQDTETNIHGIRHAPFTQQNSPPTLC